MACNTHRPSAAGTPPPSSPPSWQAARGSATAGPPSRADHRLPRLRSSATRSQRLAAQAGLSVALGRGMCPPLQSGACLFDVCVEKGGLLTRCDVDALVVFQVVFKTTRPPPLITCAGAPSACAGSQSCGARTPASPRTSCCRSSETRPGSGRRAACGSTGPARRPPLRPPQSRAQTPSTWPTGPRGGRWAGSGSCRWRHWAGCWPQTSPCSGWSGGVLVDGVLSGGEF